MMHAALAPAGRGGLQDAGRGSSLRSRVAGARQRHLSDAQQPDERHRLLLRRRRVQRVRQQRDVRRRALSHAVRVAVHADKYTAAVCLSSLLRTVNVFTQREVPGDWAP